jgi:hypothetical protein
MSRLNLSLVAELELEVAEINADIERTLQRVLPRSTTRRRGSAFGNKRLASSGTCGRACCHRVSRHGATRRD